MLTFIDKTTFLGSITTTSLGAYVSFRYNPAGVAIKKNLVELYCPAQSCSASDLRQIAIGLLTLAEDLEKAPVEPIQE